MKTNKKGFSLIELMIVVAILGILAAVAVPAFTKFMYNSKSAEIPSNFDGILKSEQAYFGSNDAFTPITSANSVPCTSACKPSTSGGVGKSKCSTTVSEFSDSTVCAGAAGFIAIQFSPSGNVYGSYSAPTLAVSSAIDGTATSAGIAGITVTAITNIDGDATLATWTQAMGIAAASGDIFVAQKISKSGDDF